MKIGVVLGVLEGLAQCVPVDEPAYCTNDVESDIQKLYDRARAELTLQKIYDVSDRDDERVQGGDPCARLKNTGEHTIARWEQTIMNLLDRI